MYDLLLTVTCKKKIKPIGMKNLWKCVKEVMLWNFYPKYLMNHQKLCALIKY